MVFQKHTLPIMQSCVIVLLKLLLATVTGPGAPAANLQAPIYMSPTSEQPRQSALSAFACLRTVN